MKAAGDTTPFCTYEGLQIGTLLSVTVSIYFNYNDFEKNFKKKKRKSAVHGQLKFFKSVLEKIKNKKITKNNKTTKKKKMSSKDKR